MKPLSKGLGDILISRPVMAKMGYITQALLGTAREARAEYDMVGTDDCSSPVVAMLPKLESERRSEPAVEEKSLYPLEETVCFLDAVTDDEAMMCWKKYRNIFPLDVAVNMQLTSKSYSSSMSIYIV